ncbi:hypothetical protein CEXT_744231 [Caerostris extrusa]|uniref:Uncharacterized protein n=1 Tax=Caerostris extrusa TaxID=172846 RepID=A0AAV4Q956_CAEEX|nr:hypothetical protein CEXT_744231 [Caerostris extrusa]
MDDSEFGPAVAIPCSSRCEKIVFAPAFHVTVKAHIVLRICPLDPNRFLQQRTIFISSKSKDEIPSEDCVLRLIKKRKRKERDEDERCA